MSISVRTHHFLKYTHYVLLVLGIVIFVIWCADLAFIMEKDRANIIETYLGFMVGFYLFFGNILFKKKFKHKI